MTRLAHQSAGLVRQDLFPGECPAGYFLQITSKKKGGKGSRGHHHRMLLKEAESGDKGKGKGKDDAPGQVKKDDKGESKGKGKDDAPGQIKFDDDLFKRAACTACNDTATQNLVTNLWPACCTSPLVWNGTACA
eukprot:gene6640-6866_t